MWNYLCKRLLIAIPTLLGITVLTFCIIRLAPGDPTRLPEASGQGPYENYLNPAHIEKTRKLFGLHKPVLINLDVKDRRRSVLAAWERAQDGLQAALPLEGGHLSAGEAGTAGGQSGAQTPDLEEARAQLIGLGKRLVPYLVPVALETEQSGEFDFLSQVLIEGAGLEAASSRTTLQSWWAAHASDFQHDAVVRRLLTLESFPEAEWASQARTLHEELGDLLWPVLMERIAALEDGPLRRRWVALAAPRAGYPGKLTPRSEHRRYSDAEQRLDRWWREEGLAFREIGPGERLLKTVTETQYAFWLSRIVHLDFGESFIDYQPVLGKVWDGFKVTFSFQIIVVFLIYLISVPLGVFSAVRQDTMGDRVVTLGLFMLYSLPNFWVAYLLIYFLGEGELADLFPIQGLNSEGAEALAPGAWLLDRIRHMILPVACMTYGGLAALSRYTRAGMLEVIRQDYIRTARAKGLSERVVVVKHALRNGIIPVVTLLGGLLPTLFSGSVIVEYIFGIHGMGWLGYTAVLQRDYPVVMAIAFFSALLVLLGTLLSDLLYALVDPRIGFKGGG